jgi:hypothetical protein
MEFSKLTFTGMNIEKQVESLVKTTLKDATCNGMTEDELKAYELGVKNTLSSLNAILDVDRPVVNINCFATNRVETHLTENDIVWIFAGGDE